LNWRAAVIFMVVLISKQWATITHNHHSTSNCHQKFVVCRPVGYPVCALFLAQLPHIFSLFSPSSLPLSFEALPRFLMRVGCCSVSAVVLTRRFGLGIPFCTYGLENIRYWGKLCNIHLRFWFVSLLLRK
jgi:hypothetical protein